MTAQPPPDLEVLYRILVQTARRRTTMSYEDVSHAYEQRMGIWYHYHGTWDEPLGQINNIVYERVPTLPALSAVVIKKPPDHKQGMPGGAFWGCCPSVPNQPRNTLRRIEVWSQILNDIYATYWPDELPRE